MLKMGKQWHPRRVFQHEYKEAIDTEANRLCAEAIKAGEKGEIQPILIFGSRWSPR